MLFNINSLKWDEELLNFFNIPKEILPEVIPSSQNEIICDHKIFAGKNIPISGVIGDQQGALFGQRCFSEGDIKSTYGTGCFVLMNTGAKKIESKNKLLTTVAWNIGGKTVYALEGAVFIAGAVVQWLRDSLQIIEKSSQTESMAQKSKNNSVLFVPSFSGLGSPHWDPGVKGAIFGLTRDSSRDDIVKASLEGIAYQAKDLIEAFEGDLGVPIGEFKTDGGATKNKYLMQFQSDILQKVVKVAKMNETTALGAAFLAGLATKYFPDIEAIKNIPFEEDCFKPNLSEDESKKLYKKWLKAVELLKQF